MATAKTTNTKPKATTKPTAKSTTKTTSSVKTAPVQPETVKETVVEVKAVEVKPQPKTYAPTDGITCESVTFGKLGLIGAKTGLNYEWLNEGDTIEVEYQDLIAELNRGSSYVLKPYFVVLDDDIIDKYPKVKSLYASMYSLDEMRDAINLRKTRMDRVRAVIMHVPDERGQHILIMRYMEFLKWDQIAETMCYDVRQIHRIHNQALQHVELILHSGSVQPSPTEKRFQEDQSTPVPVCRNTGQSCA